MKKGNFNETKNNMKMSWYFIKNEKKTLFIMSMFTIILSLISIAIPILSAKIMLNLTGGIFDELIKFSIFMFIVEITRNIISKLSMMVSEKYVLKVVTNIQLKMVEEITKIETKEIDKISTGTLIDRLNDANGIVNIFSRILDVFVDFISNFGVLIVAMFINFYMFIFLILSSLVISYLDKKRRDVYYKEYKNYRKVNEEKTSLATEIVRGVRDIKLLNAQKGILSRVKKKVVAINNEKLKMEKNSYKFSFISSSIRDLLDVIFIALGVILVKYSDLTIANFLILYMYRGRIENLLSYYDRFANLIKDYNVSATRVFEVLGDHFAKESTSGIMVDSLKGNIEFKNVNFGYDDELVLKNVSFSITSGERVGFVGASGSGKSTIFSLIARLYSLNEGNILIDNMDIKDISIDSLRKNISLISQSPYIFNFSVLDNLKLGNNNISDEEIEKVCKKANIYDKIMELDDKFDTLLGEGGVILSGGEKQRLSIARSLLKESNIILFDEATSSLDNIAQDKVQRAIYGLDKSKTVLIIAHRLSTVINCDKIVVIDDGKVLDVGTHKELLDRCTKYKKLFMYEKREENL